ncbi:hypothetical protein CSQ89_07770 [Chitinimonas sp. BJB300]|nr:hypothetical protein CSQ89_07770 [Chitinimonas sp. BJB300]
MRFDTQRYRRDAVAERSEGKIEARRGETRRSRGSTRSAKARPDQGEGTAQFIRQVEISGEMKDLPAVLRTPIGTCFEDNFPLQGLGT